MYGDVTRICSVIAQTPIKLQPRKEGGSDWDELTDLPVIGIRSVAAVQQKGITGVELGGLSAVELAAAHPEETQQG